MTQLARRHGGAVGAAVGVPDSLDPPKLSVDEGGLTEFDLRLAPFAERIGSALQTVIHEALVLDEIDARACGDDYPVGRLHDACQGLWQASTAISDALMSLEPVCPDPALK